MVLLPEVLLSQEEQRMADAKRIDEALNQYLRLQTFPVAVRMCESEDELPERVRIPQRDLGIDISL